MNNSSSEPDVCPRYQSLYRPRLVGIYFFPIYSILCVVALVGNAFILALLTSKPKLIRRQTFRFLTIILSSCEFVAACTLLLLLFRFGIGRHNRVYGTSLVSSVWTSEAENEFLIRQYTISRGLASIRDVVIGFEIFAYTMLAVDRLLAIVAPTSKRWNTKAAGFGILIGFIVLAMGEITLQISHRITIFGVSDSELCSLVALYMKANTVTKAGVALITYMVSLCTYIATGALILNRARSVSSEGDQRSQAVKHAKKPLLALVLGNIVQFISLLPLIADNTAALQMDACLYHAFYVNSALVPCLTVIFNTGIRNALIQKFSSTNVQTFETTRQDFLTEQAGLQ